MSNVYIQEPPALGKVLLKTSVGDIDVELWTKEAPRACRNFIQLCMEGYYNGTIFHRVVPEFIVQGGDPNGDGTGGESIYGAPFKDEVHSRLRFNRRGLLAMANAGKDDNGSQFFFTLGATPELQNKHTIFGKVTGETIFNMLKLSEGEIGPDERPVYPQKITGAEIIINPFEDIVPRVKLKTKEDEGSKKKKKDRAAVKNFGLLSFGMEAEEEEGEAVEFRGKAKSTHDLLDDPKLGKKTAAELDLEEPAHSSTEPAETSQAITNIREKLKSKKEVKESKSAERKKKEKGVESKKKELSGSESEGEYYLGKDKDIQRRKERDRIRGEISQLKKDMKRPKNESSSAETKEEDKTQFVEKENELKKQYEEEQEKYRQLKEKIPKKGAARSKRSKLTRRNPIQRKPWVKNLYENRDYPDNYTDKKFLQDLRKNLHVQKVTLSEAVTGAYRVTLRLCFCVLYAVLYVHMYNDWIQTDLVILVSIIVTILGYISFLFHNAATAKSRDVLTTNVECLGFLDDCKTVLAYLVLGYLVSPILHTLTDTVSTDTIYALTVLMMIVHLIFFDYGVPAAIVSNSLSVNAAIFASVCLVSRLSEPFDAYILLTVSVLFFVLTQPLFKVMIGTMSFNAIFFFILILTVVSLGVISKILLYYFVFAVVFVNIYCPYMFVRWQKYKDNIHGPWDEAIVRDSDDINDCLGLKD